MRLTWLFFIAFFVSSCDEKKAPRQYQSIAIEGVVVPGRASDAKSSGFTTCSVNYYSMTCTREVQKLVFGILPYKASVTLNAASNFNVGDIGNDQEDVRNKPLEALSYRSVEFEFGPPSSFNYCDSDHPNLEDDACRQLIAKKTLIRNLEMDGYESWQWRSYSYFVKRDSPILITLGGLGRDNGFSIEPETLDAINERLDQIAAQKKAAATAEKSAESLVEGMKPSRQSP